MLIGYISSFDTTGINGTVTDFSGNVYNFYNLYEPYKNKIYLGTIVQFSTGYDYESGGTMAQNISVPYYFLQDNCQTFKAIEQPTPLTWKGTNYSVNTFYYVWVKDKQENVSALYVKSDAIGNITLNNSNLPQGFFNDYFGDFIVLVTSDILRSNVIPYVDTTGTYPLIVFTK
jgi:hypothetical protein